MKRILLIYHFFYPDTVVSARLFSDLAKYLAGHHYTVTVFTGNQLIRTDDIAPFIVLARACLSKGIDAAFCFAGYGNGLLKEDPEFCGVK